MQLVEKHIIKPNNIHFLECKRICKLSKNLYNHANYLVRKEFINSSKEKENGIREYAIYLNYYDIRKILIDNVDYISLPRKVSNQTLMKLDSNWKSFFKAIKEYNKHPSKFTGKPNLPKYLDKINGEFITTYEEQSISKKELKKGFVLLSGTTIKIPTDKSQIKQCRIVPKNNQYVVEIIYNYEEKQLLENNNKYYSIDLGVNNLATVSSNVKEIQPYILNGKPLKSINQYYNKKLAYLKSNLEKRQNKKTSKNITKLTNKRNEKITDYLHKGSRYIINQLVSNQINTLIIGKNDGWKQEVNIGDKNNQNFVNIPHSRFINMLEYKSKLAGINVIIREESYTSRCSFLDGETIKKQESYKGCRIKRGLFKSAKGILINADLNGSYNILIKAVPKAFVDGIEGVAVHPIVITIKK